MIRQFAALCLAVVMVMGAFARLGAQEPSAPGNASAQQPAKAPTPDKPAPLRWHGSANASAAVAGGAQSQRGYQLGASVERPFTSGGAFSASFSRQYQRVKFPSESVLADRMSISVGAEEDFANNTVAMVRSLYLKDKLLYVDYRFEQLVGYGLRLIDASKRFTFYLVPGVSIFKQDLAYSDITDWEYGGGIYEKFTGKLNEAWSIGNEFRYRRNFSDHDISIESVASVHGMFTKTLGLQVEYQYNHESIVPPHFPEYLQVLSVGLRFQF